MNGRSATARGVSTRPNNFYERAVKIEMGKDGQARTAIRPCVAGGSDPIQWIRSVLKEKGDACQGGCDQLNLRNLLEKTIYISGNPFNTPSTHSVLTLAIHPFL